MNRFCIFISLCVQLALGMVQAQELGWKDIPGGPSLDTPGLLATDSSGNGYASFLSHSPFTGAITYTNQNDNREFAGFISQYQPNGTNTWTAHLQGFELSEPVLAVASDETILIAGTYSQNLSWHHPDRKSTRLNSSHSQIS